MILPTHNGSKYLRQSIDSCLSQTYRQFELIIVNDCSTDDTEEIVKSYSDPRIRYVKNEHNLKLPKTLNRGFELAQGAYFTWTSDDNYFAENAIEKMVFALESGTSDLVCAPYYTIDGNNVITGSRQVGPYEAILRDNIVKACFLYKREAHKKLRGYHADLFLVEDYDFWIRAVYHGFRFSFLEEKLYYYRFHEKSLTESRRKDIAVALYGLLDKHVKLFENSEKTDFINSEVYLHLAKIAAGINKENGHKYIVKALKTDLSVVLNKDFWKVVLKIL